MWTYHRALQLLSTFSCFNAYLLLNVSILIKQDLWYFPLPGKCFWVYLRKTYKDVNIWYGDTKQEWFNKHLKIKELFRYWSEIPKSWATRWAEAKACWSWVCLKRLHHSYPFSCKAILQWLDGKTNTCLLGSWTRQNNAGATRSPWDDRCSSRLSFKSSGSADQTHTLTEDPM